MFDGRGVDARGNSVSDEEEDLKRRRKVLKKENRNRARQVMIEKCIVLMKVLPLNDRTIYPPTQKPAHQSPRPPKSIFKGDPPSPSQRQRPSRKEEEEGETPYSATEPFPTSESSYDGDESPGVGIEEEEKQPFDDEVATSQGAGSEAEAKEEEVRDSTNIVSKFAMSVRKMAIVLSFNLFLPKIKLFEFQAYFPSAAGGGETSSNGRRIFFPRDPLLDFVQTPSEEEEEEEEEETRPESGIEEEEEQGDDGGDFGEVDSLVPGDYGYYDDYYQQVPLKLFYSQGYYFCCNFDRKTDVSFHFIFS